MPRKKLPPGAVLPGALMPLLSFDTMELLAFSIQGGMFMVQLDLKEKMLYGEADGGDPNEIETLVWVDCLCPHCREEHHVGVVWHPAFGIFIADTGGLILADTARYPEDWPAGYTPAWHAPPRRPPDA